MAPPKILLETVDFAASDTFALNVTGFVSSFVSYSNNWLVVFWQINMESPMPNTESQSNIPSAIELTKDIDNKKTEQKSIDGRDTMSQMEMMRLLGLRSISEKSSDLQKSRKVSVSVDP